MRFMRLGGKESHYHRKERQARRMQQKMIFADILIVSWTFTRLFNLTSKISNILINTLSQKMISGKRWIRMIPRYLDGSKRLTRTWGLRRIYVMRFKGHRVICCDIK
ncbi:unnamed protein product [Meloidogyne enterolobii]|uniref:Uncharacterized protein n=1 Tax=Meloidogyne enterolobii TaxID=390850 RepID=A0ACB0Z6R7_MELEN